MQLFNYLIILAPVLALASPVDVAERQALTKCCYSGHLGQLTFVTTEDGEYLDTLSWCYIQFARDPASPNDCEKASRRITYGYCELDDPLPVKQCAA
ncbi:hypothetical protein BKA66DRAFT_573184 [Pyrenochaeta sp. MPI-SDFR-AT-0127]|nr:hypothetical protein BKA66DRAFT_573184 [Pyrenochaeta sp. MPI-SDFR-AT-0127]